MMLRSHRPLAAAAAALAFAGCAGLPPATPQGRMTFFLTGSNPGRGADLGGLAGADRHCQALAESVGAGKRTWRAYLSTTAAGGIGAINARDRIGRGPWQNVAGQVIARDVEDLHGAGNRIDKTTALTERGEMISGRGDAVNLHDVLTGSTPDGRAIAGDADTTCGNWTKGGADGSAMVGHHDRRGLDDGAAAKSWNSSHPTRGCSLDALKTTGGGGLLYCFAVD